MSIFAAMIDEIIDFALREDLQDGDHSSLSTIPENAMGSAKLLVKDHGIAAGVELAEQIFKRFDDSLEVEVLIKDGESIKPGDIILTVEGSSRSILSTERLVLNFMQRMSGIATHTRKIVQLLEGCETKLLDTRKTTPCIRAMEKWAVKIGGAYNHRFGLYDMIMIKDNHIDYAGGIPQAIHGAKDYLQKTGKDLKIEIEVRNNNELKQVLEVGGVDRIMLDNYTPQEISEILPTIPSEYETEASGGITIENIRAYGETGINYISSGALTHSISSLDLSLKANFKK